MIVAEGLGAAVLILVVASLAAGGYVSWAWCSWRWQRRHEREVVEAVDLAVRLRESTIR